MVVSEDFIKKVYSGGDIPLKGPLLTPLPPRPYNLMKPITSLTNINSKIKKMRCNVCQSQSSIDKVMGRNQKVCDMCETIITNAAEAAKKAKLNANIAALSYAPGSTNLKFPPRPSGEKPGGLGNNPLDRVNTNLLGKNTESAFNTPGSLNLEAIANARAAAKNNGLGNNPLDSVNTNLLGKNTESAFNTPGSLNLEAMANARDSANQLKNNGLGNNPLSGISNNALTVDSKGNKLKNNGLGNNPLSGISNNALTAYSKANTRKANALKNNNTMKETKRSLLKRRKEFAQVDPQSLKKKLIQVENVEGNKVWIDPKNNSVYLNSNATISTENSLGGINGNNKGKLWYRKTSKNESKYLNMTKENYNAKKTNTKATRKNRKNRRSTRRSTRTTRR